MNLAGVERRLGELERRAGITDLDRNVAILLELLPGLVEVWLERESLRGLGLGVAPDPAAEDGGDALRDAIRRHPAFTGEVARRLPVLKAWGHWHDVYEAPYRGVLAPTDRANWPWAVSAVAVARRDGPRNEEECAMLDAANEARVGTDDQERARVRSLTLEALCLHTGGNGSGAPVAPPPRGGQA